MKPSTTDELISALRVAIESSHAHDGRRFVVTWPYLDELNTGPHTRKGIEMAGLNGLGDSMPWLSKLGRLLMTLGTLIAALTGAATVSMIRCNGIPTPPPITVPTPPPSTAPTPPPGTDPNPKPNPVAAICQIQFGNAGCTATWLYPQLPDGRWQGMTAAHCVKGQPSQGVAVLKDGRRLRVVVQASFDEPDVAFIITETPVEIMPYAILAKADAEPGEKIWHMGYGTDRPGNREDGSVNAKANPQGQCEYTLSVSHGDSGGGIALNSNGEILSPVCCTTAIGRTGRVWGCSPVMARKLRPLPIPAIEEWTPIPIPLRMPAD